MVCCAGRPCSQSPDVCCHSSQGQPAQQACPDISRLEVGLQQQWDHDANAHLNTLDIKPHSNIKVWWICDQCPDGHLHRWEARVSHRTGGRGCPQCCGRKVCKHNSLATKDPLVAAQWDYEANDGTPDGVVAFSNQTVGWLCDVCGHKWSATPGKRVFSRSKTGCPECAHTAKTKKRTKHPTFAECQDPRDKAVLAEWDYERNAPLGNFPNNTTLRSAKQIFWLCTKCPAGQQHSWCTAPYNRTSRSQSGCPYCAGKNACKCNSLQALFPDMTVEWDFTKNEGQPSDHTRGSHHRAWWCNPLRGSWQQSINGRTKEVQQKHARRQRIQQSLHPASGP